MSTLRIKPTLDIPAWAAECRASKVWQTRAGCSAFQNTKRGEVCRIPGCTSPIGVPGSPATMRLPHYSESNFRKCWEQLRISNLILQDSGVFEMLGAAQELGLEELRLSCEDHVTATLDVSNACTFLAAALEMNERSAPHVIKKM
ncbi:hypothetical protein B566_EDAN014117 [Ephemera danica]|nr:hypothetical protein B566_EDAN014117 [Ephemera danica]